MNKFFLSCTKHYIQIFILSSLGFSQKSTVLHLIDFIEIIHRHKKPARSLFTWIMKKHLTKFLIQFFRLSTLDLDSDLVDLLQGYLSDRIQHVKKMKTSFRMLLMLSVVCLRARFSAPCCSCFS